MWSAEPVSLRGQRWTFTAYVNVRLFDGFRVQMIDDAQLYDDSDEDGRLGEWIPRYERSQTPWNTSNPSAGVTANGRLFHPEREIPCCPASGQQAGIEANARGDLVAE
jgi:hypothetical protein